MTQSEQHKIYFGYDEMSDHPIDGLHTCADVIYTLGGLIDTANDLDQLNSRQLSGIGLIISSVHQGINIAIKEIRQREKTIISDHIQQLGAPFEIMRTEKTQRAWIDGFNFAKHETIERTESHHKTNSDILTNRANIKKPETHNQAIIKAMEEDVPIGKIDQHVTNDVELDEKKTPKHIEVREKLIAASYEQGHSISDISQAVNIKKQYIKRVLLDLTQKGELSLRSEDEQAIVVNQ